MKTHYVVKPKADRDLDDYADDLAEEANLNLALGFLAAADEAFTLLARQPNMGWRSRIRHAELAPLQVLRVTGFEHLLIFIDRSRTELTFCVLYMVRETSGLCFAGEVKSINAT